MKIKLGFLFTIIFFCNVILLKSSESTLKTNKGNSPDIELLFEPSFINQVKKANNGIFPLEIIYSNPFDRIYQIAVLSQKYEGFCSKASIIGNTCGRHSLKNSIIGIQQILAYWRLDIASFLEQHKNLTSKTGNLIIRSETDLPLLTSNIFKIINDYLIDYRKGIGQKIALEKDTMSIEEVKYLIENIDEIAKKCKLSEINSELISTIADIKEILKIPSVNAMLTFEDSINIGKQIVFSYSASYLHSFIIGVMDQKHWITIIVFRDANGALNYIPMDSLGHLNWPEFNLLKRLLENYDVASLFEHSFKMLKSFKFNQIDIYVENFSNGKINNHLLIEEAPLPLKTKIFNNFLRDLAQILIDAKKLADFIEIIKTKNSKFKTDFNLQDYKNWANTILKEKLNMFEIPVHISEIFESFFKSEDLIKLTNDMKQIEIKDLKIKESIKKENMHSLDKGIQKIKNPSIFGKFGLRETVLEYKKCLEGINLAKLAKSPQKNKEDIAMQILDNITQNAAIYIRNSTPLRTFLAKYGLYLNIPEAIFRKDEPFKDHLNLLEQEIDKQKKFIINP